MRRIYRRRCRCWISARRYALLKKTIFIVSRICTCGTEDIIVEIF
jgi:hypothetical protein